MEFAQLFEGAHLLEPRIEGNIRQGEPAAEQISAREAGIRGGSGKTSSRYSLMMADSQSLTSPYRSSGTLPWGEIREKPAGLFLRSISICSAATPFSASVRRTRWAKGQSWKV